MWIVKKVKSMMTPKFLDLVTGRIELHFIKPINTGGGAGFERRSINQGFRTGYYMPIKTSKWRC